MVLISHWLWSVLGVVGGARKRLSPPVRPWPTCTAGCRLLSLARRWGRWWKMLGSCSTFLLLDTFHSFSLVSSGAREVRGHRSEDIRKKNNQKYKYCRSYRCANACRIKFSKKPWSKLVNLNCSSKMYDCLKQCMEGLLHAFGFSCPGINTQPVELTSMSKENGIEKWYM